MQCYIQHVSDLLTQCSQLNLKPLRKLSTLKSFNSKLHKIFLICYKKTTKLTNNQLFNTEKI